jgi:Uma2 family endonuclease
MGNAASPLHVPYEDYLALEASGDAKHEWSDGVVYAMSRGTPEHARLSLAIGSILRSALANDCSVYASDAMLWIERAKLSTYADATVVCGPLETKKVTKDGRSLGEAIANPTVIVEVLSESTERYDRDGKFQSYKQASSLKEYVLVSQDEQRIEVYRRAEGPWTCETAGPGGRVTIHGHAVAVDDVYGKPR